jgi:hypothetical protein
LEAPSVPGGGDPAPGSPPITYQGPHLVAGLQAQEGGPERRVLVVAVHAPTGGYELGHDETRVRADRTEVLLTLMNPGPDDVVTQAFEWLRAPVELEAGAPMPVHVLVAQPERGVQYIRAPPHELAAVVLASESKR